MPDKISYRISVPGEEAYSVDADKFNQKKDEFFNQYPDAEVVEVSPYNQEDMKPGDYVSVSVPGEEPYAVEGRKFAKKRDEFFQQYPDAQVSRMRQVNYWGDRLTENDSRRKALEQELAGYSNNPVPTASRDENENYVETTQIVMPSKERKKAIEEELKALNEEREKNPMWRQYWDSQASDIDSLRNRAKAAKEASERGDLERDLYGVAEKLYDDAYKVATAPSKYNGTTGTDKADQYVRDMARGAWENAWDAVSMVSVANALKLGVNLVPIIKQVAEHEGEKANILELSRNPEKLTYLSDGERELLHAFGVKAEVEAGRSADLSAGYKAGKGVAQSVGFMSDFLLMGGAVENIGKKAIEKTVEGTAKRLAAETIYGAAKAAVMTPLMASSYTNFVNNMMQFNDEGGIDLSAKAIRTAVQDVLIENESELIGAAPLQALGLGVGKALPMDWLAKSKLGGWGKALRHSPAFQLMKQAGWNGMVEEMFEEVTGNALRAITGTDPDALKNFFNPEELLVTATSFAPMSLIGGAVSTAQYTAASTKMRNEGVGLEEVLKASGLDDKDIAKYIDLNSAETPTQIASQLSGAYQAAVKSGQVSPEVAMEAVMGYAKSAADYKVMTGILEEQQDADRTAMATEIETALGKDSWKHSSVGGESVRTLTDKDGNVSYVTGEKDGEFAVIKPDGTMGLVSPNAIIDGEYTDSGEMPLNDYLDSAVQQKKNAADDERMQQEAQSARRQLQENINNNVPIEMGTIEAPITGELTHDKDGAPIMNAGLYQVAASDGSLHLVSAEDLASKWGIQLQPESQEEKDDNAVKQQEKSRERKDVYNTIPKGTPIKANLEGYEEPVAHQFVRSYIDSETGDVMIVAVDSETGETVNLPEQAFPELEDVAADFSSKEGETPAAQSVDDGVARDYKGNPLPLDGEGNVDEDKLWNEDPVAWAKWNDKMRGNSQNSIEYIQLGINTEQAKLNDLQAAYATTMNYKERHAIEDEQKRVENRLGVLQNLLDSYNDVSAIEQVAAGEQAAPTTEQAARADQAQPVEQKAEQTPEEVEAERQKPLIERVKTWEARTGVPVEIISSFDQIGDAYPAAKREIEAADASGDHKIPGWFDTGSGKVVIYLPHNISTLEIDKTFMHEVISHKGLRELLGVGGFNKMLDHTWTDIMSKRDQDKYMDYVRADEMRKKGLAEGKSEEQVEASIRRAAADEYIAHLAESADTNPSAWEKFVTYFLDFLKRLIGKDFTMSKADLSLLLQASLARYEASAERRAEQAEALMRMSPEARLSNDGIAANEEETRFSVKYAPKGDEIDKVINDIVESVGVSKDQAKKWVKSETSLAAVIEQKENQPYLDYTGDDRYAAIKENSDYPQGTVDFNNICRKRIAFTEMYQRIQQAFPNVIITGEDLAKIRNIMKNHGLTVACGLCYVEDRRQLLGEIAKGFIDDYKDGFKGYSERKGAMDKPEDKGSLNARKKVADEIVEMLGEDKKDDLSIYDLITLEGSTKLYAEHPGIYNAFQRYNSNRGMAAGNLFQGYAEYKREILKWTKSHVERVNNNGGLRVFSYSDFEAHHLIDLVQIIQDCARQGVKIQGYTKVPAFARAVAETGIKLNRSLIPLGDTGIVDGKLAYDPVEGIDINDPNFTESNDNVGNILVGINDEQIRLAMEDPFVHYIIPYHSNQKEVLRTLKQTGAWTNYKSTQNERRKSDGKSVKENVNIYTDVINAAEAEGKPIKNEKQFVEKFLQVCEEKGLIPRFEQFLDRKGGKYVFTPGYSKLLLDFKMFDENGRYLPQKPVVAKFDDAFNAQILSDYVAGEQEKYDGDLDEVYNEIVDKLGLNERQPDIVAREKGEKALANILSALEKKGEAKAEEQAPAAEAAPSFEDDLLNNGYSYGNKSALEKYGLEAADLTRRGDVVTLNRLIANERKQGAGTRFMQDLAAMADRNGWSLALTPTTAFGASSVGRLNKFYKRFGFKDNKGTNTDFSISESMIRRPANETESQIRFRVSNADERVFISNAEAALDKIKMDRATPEQWIKMLEKEGGMKAAEDKWLGLSDWLKSLDRKTVNKEEIAEYIKKNQIIIEEQRYAEEVEDAYGKALNSYQEEFDAIYNGMVDEDSELAVPREPYLIAQDAFNEMVERYGEDFSMAFSFQENGDGFILEPESDWNDELSDAAKYLLDQRRENSDVRVINSTRKGYTTEGLRNLQEIALTVPTIEPWNEGDIIHFGDAGEGRAIAWVRFGDSWTSEEKDEAEKKYKEAQKEFQDYKDEIVAKYALQATGTKTTRDLATDEENKKVRDLHLKASELYHEWKYGNHKREKVLVIDEIQSKRHQEAREQGGYKDDTLLKQAEAKRDAAKKAYDDYHAALLDKYGDFNELHDKITPEENAESTRLYFAFRDAENAVARNGFDPNADEEYGRIREELHSVQNDPEFLQAMKDWREALDEYKALEEERRDTLKLALMPEEERKASTKKILDAIGRKDDATNRARPFQERSRELQRQLEHREAELAHAFNEEHKSKIPAAPFEKNWHELALKRMLRYAAEMGYDSIAWTTGEQQADRYDIGGIVPDINVTVNPDDKDFYRDLRFTANGDGCRVAVNPDGKITLAEGIGRDAEGKQLSEVFGKEVAQQIMDADHSKIIKLEGMRVGGEGMRGFYDEILPRFMNKYGKKWNAKVEDATLPALGEDQQGLTMHSVKVTPEMRESVMQGQLMFRVAMEERDKESKELFDAAKERFGTTKDLREAGYILPDGSLLDFSGRHQTSGDTSFLNGRRSIDHRDIADLNYERDLNTPSGRNTSMQDFIERGAVRIDGDSGSINLAVKPTDAQMSVIRRIIERTRGEAYIDFGADNTDHYAEYDGARPDRVVNDIRRYFDEGYRPGGNTMFRITPEQDKEYMDAVEAGDMKKAGKMVEEAARAAGYDSPKLYHGTDAFGFTAIDTGKSDDKASFWATSNEKVAGSYTKLAVRRRPGTEISDEDYEKAHEEIEEQLENGISEFRHLIDRTFSAWYFGQQGNDGIRKAILNVNPESGEGDGVYDVLEDYVVEAYHSFGDEFKDKYEDYPDWQDNSPEAEGIYEAISSLEGLRGQLWELEHGELSGGIYELFANTDNMFVVDAKGGLWSSLRPEGLPKIDRGEYKDVPYKTRDVVKWAGKNGYDGVIFKNIRDNGRYGRTEPSDVYAFLNPQSQVKSAEAVTYDDQGKVVPLSERFNPDDEDIRFRLENSIEQARAEVDTNPTDAQKEAGNYKHGHLTIDGFDISLENPKGSVRSGKDADGNEWHTTMNNDYGYIRMTEGVDGDHLDVFLSDNPSEGDVYVVDQVDSKTGEFDEHKVMYGFNSLDEAREAYLSNYSEGWQGLGTITGVTKDEFKKWIESSTKKTKPFSEYKSVNAESAQNESHDDGDDGDGGTLLRMVDDPAKIEELEAGEKETGYRNVVMNEDGTLGSPMAGKLGKKGEKSVETSGFTFDKWEEAEENPGMATEDGKINLIKPNGRGSVDGVDYNPYIHIRPNTLNKQFTQAWRRPELVYVETQYPASELTSGYKADKAKLSVGRHDWNGGELILSRYDKPVRVVPWEEVADQWEKEFKDSGVTFDIVPPDMRDILAEMGVEILPPKKSAGQPAVDAYNEWKNESVDETGDIRFSIRGISGAENAKDEQAIANLDIAEEMEAEGKDMPTIWRATGWERGADGKWRNEIPDAKQKEGVDIDTKRLNRLGDVLEAKELFDSYPELKDYTLDVKNLKNASGAFRPRTKEIVIDADNLVDGTLTSEGVRTILHEIQHAIQHIEGFARGADNKALENEYYKKEFQDNPEKAIFAWMLSRRHSARKLIGVGKDEIARQFDALDKSPYNAADRAAIEKMPEYLNGLSNDEFKSFLRGADRLAKDARNAGSEGYKKAAGEVEARNVEQRSKVPEKNRKQYAPSFSEDTPRSEQIIRFRLAEDMQTAADLVQLYEEGDDSGMYISEREVMDRFEESIPYGADTEHLYALIDKYNRLDMEDFNEGRRDFSGAEKDETFNEFLDALREFSKGDAETRFRAAAVGRSGAELVKRVQDYGLAGVMDKDSVNDFWSFVLYSLPDDIRREIIDKAIGDDLNIRRQTRAYMADLAAKGYANDATGLLFKAADQLSALIPEHQPLSYDELLYMMWRGSRRYSSNDILAMATDIAMRKRLHVGEFTGDKFPEDAKTAVEQTKSQIEKAGEERTEERSNALWKTATNPYGAIVNAMTAQKNYDQKTIDALVALAKEMMRKGDIDKVTSREMARLLTIIKAANGRKTQTMKNSADQLLDFMVDHTIATEKSLLEKVMKLKTAKVKEPGVDIISKLDIRAQGIINAFKNGMKGSVEEIQNRLAEVQNQIDSDRTSETRKEELQAEQEGLTLALRHATDIAASEAEARGIRDAINDYEKDLKALTPDERKQMEKAYREAISAAYDMIRQNKIARVEAYRNLRADLAAAIDEGVERAKTYIESERERVENIHHMANSDLQGVEFTIGKKEEKRGFQKIIHGAFEFLMSPLANTEQLFRVLGRKSPSGEGYLYNYYVRGIQRAWDEEKKGIDAAYDKLNAKVRELFGDETPTWHDLFIKTERMKAGTMKWFDASGKWVEEPVTTGNLLYIYMVNKMADGRMKLRQMGITEEDVKNITYAIGDVRLLDLADWIQEDFLTGLRDKYNAVHNRMFGTSMAAIENYFPLRIAKGAIHQEVELGKMNASELASTLTGAIIKRTVNSKQLDLLNADMFTVLSDHIDEMEEWSAFAEIRRDMNTLLSYDRFRNKVESLNTVFGKGEDLWRNMADTFGLAIKMYKPKRPHGDAGILNAAKGVSAAKVNFRVYTALKQMLSFPAFLADSRVDLLVKSLATPWMSWKWAMENLPSFKRRWETGTIGNEKLDPDEADSKIWNTKIGRFIMKDGMLPNRAVDAMTIAIGAKAMYDSKYNQYVKEGFDEAVADEKAKTDAELLFNATQQSSEGLFLSTIQKDRTLLSNIVSVFRNSSMGYGRQVLKAFRTAQRVITGGRKYREESIEYMTKQLIREGLSEDDAAKAARQRFNKSLRDSVVRYAVFGFLLEFLWNLGSNAIYLLFGDDPDEKEKMILDDIKRAELGGLVEGLAGGQAISQVLYDIRIGEKMYGKNYLQLPLAQDAKNFISELGSDKVRAVNDLVNLAFQIGIGANPQTLTDAVIAILDACNGNFETAEEVMLCILRIIQVPQSQLDQLMIDEIGMSARDARELSYEEVAERYAYYKIHREAPVTSWAYSDETMQKKVKSKKTTFKKKVNERNKD